MHPFILLFFMIVARSVHGDIIKCANRSTDEFPKVVQITNRPWITKYPGQPAHYAV